MKTSLMTGLCFALSLQAFAQNPDQALARVKYSFVHVKDTTQKNNPYTENMLLVIGKNASVYTSLDRLNRKLVDDGKAKPEPTAPNAPFKPVSFQDYYFFVKENLFFIKEKIYNEYLAEENAPKINWTTTKDTASFSGIACKKATAYFKGRNWIAWYAPELPFQSGPWKLNGLPGLIVEAYDDKQQVQFHFAGMDKVTEANTNSDSFFYEKDIKLPKDAKRTDMKEYNRIKEFSVKDPIGFASAMTGTDRKNIRMGVSMTGIAGPTVTNNPIELPEKK
ncbi:GLPGLI family protein [Pedobacter sp. KR3-3]|uniref:GLPGLI family protein n=1 Tax=Pedobacter albus TaxID=3113905 RepID=A0ABU7I3B0_9SPHI|nr:GLPGLI family protein [Pedobacter sp. KR3-3]MEE1943945.1 GLPGLI family protein [Pedobacter sp. KR3-3]